MEFFVNKRRIVMPSAVFVNPKSLQDELKDGDLKLIVDSI